MGRHKTPTELKKLTGTYREDRHGNEVSISEIAPTVTSVMCPSEIKDKTCRKAFETHTNFLTSLGLLQESDLPQLTSLFVMLQEIKKIAAELEQKPVTDSSYEGLIHMYVKLTARFDQLASAYYISPAARTRLTSDMIQIQKGKLETESITSKLLARKKA